MVSNKLAEASDTETGLPGRSPSESLNFSTVFHRWRAYNMREWNGRAGRETELESREFRSIFPKLPIFRTIIVLRINT